MSELLDPTAAGRERLATLRAELDRLRARSAANLWRVGAALLEVQRDGLWRHDETIAANSFTAWLRDAYDLPYRSARLAMRIADTFTETVAQAWGSARLNAAAAWIEATPTDERPADLLVARVRFRADDGTFRAVPFPEATVAQLRQATALLRAAARPAVPALTTLAEAAGLPPERLRVLPDAGDGLRVSVTGATRAELRALLAALDAAETEPG